MRPISWGITAILAVNADDGITGAHSSSDFLIEHLDTTNASFVVKRQIFGLYGIVLFFLLRAGPFYPALMRSPIAHQGRVSAGHFATSATLDAHDSIHATQVLTATTCTHSYDTSIVDYRLAFHRTTRGSLNKSSLFHYIILYK